jgi:hypothetical protein
MLRFQNKMIAESAVRMSSGSIQLTKSLMKEVKRYQRLGNKYPFARAEKS